ncbi:MAG: type transport system ATP-binding protein [Actinomycetota bacterium]|nr:type transport system ATP-binding protein [Actinomycetota bacterium]
MNVIEVEELTKRYRRFRGGTTVALAGLDLVVPSGGVFGFLGPNGAGKTTTIRCLLGLVRPSSGKCRLLGADTRGELAGVVGRVGAMVEAPAFFPGMSGRKNLALLGGLEGLGRSTVTASLERVGLGERGDHKVKTYSLGMKQRLGIAAALLKDPEVLILDEPANGLDPAGIKEVRELLRSLGAEGRTVFVSSHILSEVRQMCDHVAILARGKCVATGSVDEVLHMEAGGLVVGVDDVAKARSILEQNGFAVTVANDRILVAGAVPDPSRITKTLADNGVFLRELRREEADLETVFLELTADKEQP